MSEPKELKAKKLDALLQEKCGKSLWHFSYSLALNYFIFRSKEFTGGKKIESLKNQTEAAVKLRDDFWKVLPNLPSKDELLSIKEGLDAIIKDYNQVLNSKECVGGRPRRNLNVILLTWHNCINSDDNEKLLGWFRNRFIKSPTYKSFCDEVKDKFNDPHEFPHSFKRWTDRYMKKNTYERDIEFCSMAFENPVPTVAIYFNKSVQTISLDQLNCKKETPIISFPDEDILTMGDFEENKTIVF